MAAAVLLAGCFGLVVLFGIAIPIAAIILRVAAKWVTKITVKFGMAYLLVMCCGILAGVINFGINFFVVSVAEPTFGAASRLLSASVELPLNFIIYIVAYGMFIRYPAPRLAPVPLPASAPDGTLNLDYHPGDTRAGLPIGFGKGALVTLVQYLIVLGIAIVIVGFILIITAVTGGFRR